MTLLDILVKLRLDKGSFEAELKEATNEAEDAGKRIEEAGNRGGEGFGSRLSDKVSLFGSKMQEAGAKVVTVGRGLQEFGRDASVVGAALTNSITKPAINAATALGRMFLGKGWERMSVITEAKNKLKTLGVEGEHLNKTMDIIGDTVDGTAYSTAEFANTAAQAVSMGYSEDSGLAGYLQTVANLAAFTGRDVEQISSITAKVASQNKLTGETFQQLSDAAVPVLQWIQEEYGVTAEEARKMVSDGEISFADYENLVKKHLDGMATAVGDSTLQGALSSMQAYIAKVGAAFLGSEDDANSFAGRLLPLVNDLNKWLISLSDTAAQWGAVVGEVFGAVIDYVKTGKADTDSLSGSAQTLFGVIQPFIDVIQSIISVGQTLVETLGPETIAKIVAAALLAGPIISIVGGIVGGIGTLITVVGSAMSIIGPIVAFIGGSLIPALVAVVAPFLPIIAIIGAVVAAGVLLYQNWDTVKAKASELLSHLSSTWESIKASASAAWSAVKDAIITPIQNAFNTVKGWVDKLRNLFPLHVGKIFTGLKVPHISVYGGSAPFGIGGKGSAPKISVQWYKKAEETPYLFSNATLFGAGERKDEILYGRDALMKDIAEATGGGKQVTFNYSFNVYGTPNQSPREIAEEVRQIIITDENRKRMAWV